ncbi:helix-turn-helix domain-containing protein [Kineococcus aurantiacus]|uniref:Transcriptional regulator with XRE-family HTH domain n=1 Tax=Kineococcus aurantiacus TaxID=37633 RepID=A0A7Y9DN43_9ACTN|nr:helix-turn-helix domain-containing protein [Kineococcus aurantiacus]NYD23655.1 transcriptional regulator with XRE-family HTH domain [Kineococcus aurantiacus]
MTARPASRPHRVGDFLRARRDALRPEDVGLPREPGRRVPGLRREEVAQLAGISPEYYLRLEQGRDHQPSGQVLAALARALQLDVAGAQYLHRLVHPFQRRAVPAPRRGPARERDLVAVVAGFRNPAVALDRAKDVVAVNELAGAMAPEHHRPGRNVVLDTFDPQVKATTPGWAEHARRVVASLRLTADLDDPRLQEVVGRLSLQDDDFHRWWTSHEVSARTRGTLPLTLPGLGVVDMGWQDLELADHPGCVVTMFTPVDQAGEDGLDALRARAGRARGRAAGVPVG